MLNNNNSTKHTVVFNLPIFPVNFWTSKFFHKSEESFFIVYPLFKPNYWHSPPRPPPPRVFNQAHVLQKIKNWFFFFLIKSTTERRHWAVVKQTCFFFAAALSICKKMAKFEIWTELKKAKLAKSWSYQSNYFFSLYLAQNWINIFLKLQL